MLGVLPCSCLVPFHFIWIVFVSGTLYVVFWVLHWILSGLQDMHDMRTYEPVALMKQAWITITVNTISLHKCDLLSNKS